MKYLYAILALSTTCLALTTIEVAEFKEHYPQFITRMRDKAMDFLKVKEIGMAVDVQALRSRDLWNEANYFEDQDFYAYEDMDERFDNEFERIDRKFIAVADRLDDEEAPDKVKAQFVKSLKADANASINALIERYKK